jgi:hypothetical protein
MAISKTPKETPKKIETEKEVQASKKTNEILEPILDGFKSIPKNINDFFNSNIGKQTFLGSAIGLIQFVISDKTIGKNPGELAYKILNSGFIVFSANSIHNFFPKSAEIDLVPNSDMQPQDQKTAGDFSPFDAN